MSTTPQRMSDKRLEYDYGWLDDTGTKPEIVGNRFHHSYTLWQYLKAERVVVEEAKAWLKFYESILRFEGLPKAADELHTILYPAPERDDG